MEKENRWRIVKIIIYMVLILLCCFVYIKFGSIEDADEAYEKQTENPTVTPTLVPTQQPFPFRSDVEKALINAGIPVDSSNCKEIYSGNYMYEFRFGILGEKASITLCVDETDCVVYAELEFHNLNAEGVQGLYLDENQLIFEIRKRDKDNADLIVAFIAACTESMANDSVISLSELKMLSNTIVENYIKGSDFNKSLYEINYQLLCDVPYGEIAYTYYKLILKSQKE